MSRIQSLFTVVLTLAVMPVATPNAFAQQPTAGKWIRVMLVGPDGNHAVPCSRYSWLYMRSAVTPYCLSDAKLAELNRIRLSIIGDNWVPQPRVPVVEPSGRNNPKLVPPPAGRVVVAPLRPETQKLFRAEGKPSRRVANEETRTTSPTTPSRNRASRFNGGQAGGASRVSGSRAPAPSVRSADARAGQSGGRAQRQTDGQAVKE